MQGSQTLTFVQDALGRLTSQTGPLGTIGYTYDAAGRRLTMSYPGSVLTVNYDYDVTGNVTKIRENGATSGVGVLATYAYDDLGQATSVTFGNGSVQSFAYNTGSQLTTLTNDLGGSATTHDLTQTFSYNPAGQIGSVTRSNDAYAWQAHYNVDRNYVADGLNRIMSAGGVGFTYDARGNLTSDGTNSYTYTAENLLKTGPSSATLAYDPLGRLYETVGGGVTTRFQYDGSDLIAEHNGSNAVQRRYVHGPGVDDPIVWYEGSAISNTTRRFLMADERGSVVSVTDSAGATIAINAYDEYGIPAPGNVGRFGYTGQTWLPEVKMWYDKARIYAPTLGRFLQTDPIGYADGMNWYAYVGADPVNRTDPMGLDAIAPPRPCLPDEICVNGRRLPDPDPDPPPLPVWFDWSKVQAPSYSLSQLGNDPNEIMTAEPNLLNDKACDIINRKARKARNELPGRLTVTSAWNSIGWLEAYRDSYQTNADQWRAVSGAPAKLLGLAISFVPAVRVIRAGQGLIATGGLGLTGIGLSEYIQGQLEWNENNIRNINARIDQLESGC